MIKLEMHAHTKGGSPCAEEEPSTLIKIYKEAGYGGVVLTNHLSPWAYDGYPGTTKDEKIEYYISLYKEFKKECEENGLKCFFGAEVCSYDKHYFSEYLIYGLKEEHLRNNPLLFTLTQKELFDFSNENGLFMAQSHPFRKGVRNGFAPYMHGVEVYNGHKGHVNNNEVARVFAKAYDLIAISGTDFHHNSHFPTGGILIPENLETNEQLVKYLFERRAIILEG